MIITIHQPEHLVWLGLIDKISKADYFVILDNVQFSKNYFHNRNKIRTSEGWSWMTVPVQRHPLNTNIIDIEILDNQWEKSYLRKLSQAYSSTEFFDAYYPAIETEVMSRTWSLCELNIRLLNLFLEWFSIQPHISRASQLDLSDKFTGSERILKICKSVGATRYLSGVGGRNYLDIESFLAEGITVDFHSFDHPIYDQRYVPFIPGMSSLDILMNQGGERALEMLCLRGKSESEI